MWNAIGIFSVCCYIGSILIIVGLFFSVCLDEFRIDKSSTEKRKKYLEKNQTIKMYLIAMFLVVYFGTGIIVSERDSLHEVGVSDSQCAELTEDYGLEEQDMREYLIITLNNGRSLDEALDFLKEND